MDIVIALGYLMIDAALKRWQWYFINLNYYEDRYKKKKKKILYTQQITT